MCMKQFHRNGLQTKNRPIRTPEWSRRSINTMSTFEDQTETTPAEITHHTTGNSMTSSSSRGAVFYFQCAVLVVGVVGAASNGLILYALVASKQHKKQLLIFNQNALDFVSCLFLGVAYSVKLCNIDLSGTGGYWLCLILLSDTGNWSAFVGSLINLAAVSIERYLKVVHHAWAQANLRKWMTYSAAAFAWISGVVFVAAVIIPSTAVVNGVCYTRRFFSRTGDDQMTLGSWRFLLFNVIILLVMIFCYGRILVAIRRQARVMAAHRGPAGSNAAHDQSHRIQTNLVKTMIIVCVLYATTWAPLCIYSLLNIFRLELTIGEYGLYNVLFIGYLYICINPFIYATKFDPVRRILLGLLSCNKTTQPLETVNNTG